MEFASWLPDGIMIRRESNHRIEQRFILHGILNETPLNKRFRVRLQKVMVVCDMLVVVGEEKAYVFTQCCCSWNPGNLLWK